MRPQTWRTRVLILAGGKGQRLHPFTACLPKPLIPINDKTILEIILGQVREAGMRDITLSVNHLAPLISSYFGDGSKFGVNLSYLYENEPLGTAGPIANLEQSSGTLLVMNGDLLTDMDLSAFLDRHSETGAVMSVATKLRRSKLRFGVVEVDRQGQVTGVKEKPVSQHRISMGIYAIEAGVRARIEAGARMDMPDLIRKLAGAGERVCAYDHKGEWIDIGQPEDLARAQKLFT